VEMKIFILDIILKEDENIHLFCIKGKKG